jgi:O-antigen/teichoic acid export membrane protein
VVRFSHATGRRDRASQVLALAAFLKLYLIMALAIVILGYFFCPFAAERFFHGDRIVGYYGWALCLMGFIDLMRAMTVATLQGARHMQQVARYESAIAVTRVLVLSLAVVGGFGLAGIVFGTILAYTLSSVMGFRFYHLLRQAEGPERPPGLMEVIRAVPRARVKDFFSLGFFIALNKNLMVAVQIFATFFMASVSFMSTGHLRIAWILMLGLTMLLGGVGRNLLPSLGFRLGEAGEKDISRMGRSLLRVAVASGVLFIAATGCFLLILPWVVRLLYGAEFKESVDIVLILAVSHLVLGFAVVVEPFYIYADRIKTAVVINTLIFATAVPAGYFLKSYGPYGVAVYITAARSAVVIHFVYMILYFRRARRRRSSEAPKGEGP